MSNDFIFGQILRVPPITRYMTLLIIAVTLLVYVDAVSPYSLYYSPLFLKRFEMWRILTSFLYFGKPTLDVFMHIVFLYRYSKMLEEGCLNTSEYFWLVLVVMSALFTIANMYGISALGTSFSATITYIWTKRNPRAIVQIFGFVSFPAFYLPFILPGFMLLSRRSISIDDVLGIVVGHLFHYFKDVYPRWGRDVLRTPCWAKKLFNEHPSSCCKVKRGIMIGEGRMRHERVKVQDEAIGLNHTDFVDSTDMAKEETHDSTASKSNPRVMVSQEGAHVSATDSLLDLSNEVSGLGVFTKDKETPDKEITSQSDDEWSDNWGVPTSEEDTG